MKVASDNICHLLVAVAAGDEKAFRRLYQDHAGWILNITVRILRDRAIAEDAVQDTFVRIWRNSARFDPQLGNGRSWISIIARNAAFDLARKRRPIFDIDIDIADVGDADALAVEAKDPPDRKLAQCLSRLPPEQARAITTMYNYGLSHSELAETLGVPLGTAKSWVQRGTKALRTEMMEEGALRV